MVLRSSLLASFSAVLVLAGCSAATTSPTPAPAPVPSSSSTAPTAPPVDPPVDETPKLTAYTEAEVQQLFDSRCVRCHDAQSANLDLSAPFTATTVGVRTGGTAGKTVCAKTSDFTVRIKPGD